MTTPLTIWNGAGFILAGVLLFIMGIGLIVLADEMDDMPFVRFMVCSCFGVVSICSGFLSAGVGIAVGLLKAGLLH